MDDRKSRLTLPARLRHSPPPARPRLCDEPGCEFAAQPGITKCIGHFAEQAEKPPVTCSTINVDASERGLFDVVDGALLGKFSESRRRALVGNIVIAVARWRETFRDCGCWRTADGYALCDWHERMLQSQVGPLRAALSGHVTRRAQEVKR